MIMTDKEVSVSSLPAPEVKPSPPGPFPPLSRRVNKAGKQERIEYCLQLYLQFGPGRKYALTDLVMERFSISRSQAFVYLAKACDKIVKLAGRPLEVQIQEAIATLDSIIYNKQSSSTEKIKAIHEKMLMMGGMAPIRLSTEGTGHPFIDRAKQKEMLTNKDMREEVIQEETQCVIVTP